jgi:outer membrane protein
MLAFVASLQAASTGKASDHPFSLGEHQAGFHSERLYDLPALVELALANNPSTRSSWFQALASAASVGQSKSSYYPQLHFNATGGYSQILYPTQSGPLIVNNAGIDPGFRLEYLLLDFGRRTADVRNTTALLQAANFDFNRTLQATLYAVQQGYFSYTAALAEQEAATASVDFSRTTLEMIVAQKASGLATEPELLIARKNLTRSEFDLTTAKRNIAVALGNLRVVAGLPANAPLQVAPPSGSQSVQELSGKVDQLIDTALASRPDLAARNADVRASTAATDRARGEFMPRLSLQGNYDNSTFGFYGKQGNSAGTFFGNNNEFSGFAVLSWDLFDGFERVEKLKKRQAEESKARALAETTRLDATKDVWIAYNDSLKSRKQLDYAATSLSSAEENFASLQQAFHNGLATITDLLASQSAFAEARYEQAGAQADYLTSLAALSLAMGSSTPKKEIVK